MTAGDVQFALITAYQDIQALTDEVGRLKIENEALKRQVDILIENTAALDTWTLTR